MVLTKIIVYLLQDGCMYTYQFTYTHIYIHIHMKVLLPKSMKGMLSGPQETWNVEYWGLHGPSGIASLWT